MHNLEALLEQSNELPSLPEIYIKVTELLESEYSTAHEIGDAVQTDPSLTAKILKMVNSAYFGLPNQVSSVSQAVNLLGRQQLQNILMSTVLAGVFKDIDLARFSLRDFWQHSIKTAIIARHLAMQNAYILDHEAFFTAGLLHDIGRLVLARAAPDEVYEVARQVKEEGADAVQLESQMLGVTHVELGAVLMDKWNMPTMLTQCVIKHHDTEHEGVRTVDTSIVYLANRLSHFVPSEDEEGTQEILDTLPSWQLTKCTVDQVHVACQLADEQWLGVMESLGMIDMEINDELGYDDLY